MQFSGDISPWLQPVIDDVQKRRSKAEISQVIYESQKGGNQLLKIATFDF